ncbi:hypothetical protein NGA35_13795 [Pseudomonas stutzeri]|nr:hypothetical protein [Stutzerimonas stutzeri]
MDYFIIFVTTVTGLYFHWWLYRRIQRWTDRDLALSFAGDDPVKRDYMLASLEEARTRRVRRKALEQWLAQAAAQYPGDR